MVKSQGVQSDLVPTPYAVRKGMQPQPIQPVASNPQLLKCIQDATAEIKRATASTSLPVVLPAHLGVSWLKHATKPPAVGKHTIAILKS